MTTAQITATLHRWRPREVYAGGALLWVLLFLNPVGAWNYGLKRFFDVGSSIVCGLIRGIGDDSISAPEAVLLLWILALAYAGLLYLKAPQISNWLWGDAHLKARRYQP